MSDWNDKIIEEFRGNAGRVGENFDGSPLVLVHSTGRKSGTERVTPMMYQAGPGDTIYVFASKAGAPSNPDWYYNLTSGKPASVEIGTQRYPVAVEELTGQQRDDVYTRQAAAYPGFAEYESKVGDARIIPVLALTRST